MDAAYRKLGEFAFQAFAEVLAVGEQQDRKRLARADGGTIWRTLAKAAAGFVPPSIGWRLSIRPTRLRRAGTGASARSARRGLPQWTTQARPPPCQAHEVQDGQAGGVPGYLPGSVPRARAPTRNRRWRI